MALDHVAEGLARGPEAVVSWASRQVWAQPGVNDCNGLPLWLWSDVRKERGKLLLPQMLFLVIEVVAPGVTF
jgi:hypothetical protein